MSYTSFVYDVFAVEQEKEQLKAVLRVRNTGKCDGAKVVQIYAAKEEASLIRPDKSLSVLHLLCSMQMKLRK